MVSGSSSSTGIHQISCHVYRVPCIYFKHLALTCWEVFVLSVHFSSCHNAESVVAMFLAQATCHSKHSIKVGPLHSRAWLSAAAGSSAIHALTARCTPIPPACNTQSMHGCPLSVSACDAVACPLCGIFCRANSSCNQHMQPCQNKTDKVYTRCSTNNMFQIIVTGQCQMLS